MFVFLFAPYSEIVVSKPLLQTNEEKIRSLASVIVGARSAHERSALTKEEFVIPKSADRADLKMTVFSAKLTF
jgi:hypothetical protein